MVTDIVSINKEGSIRRAILTQHKTRINQQKQIQKLQNNVTPIIDTTWITDETSKKSL